MSVRNALVPTLMLLLPTRGMRDAWLVVMRLNSSCSGSIARVLCGLSVVMLAACSGLKDKSDRAHQEEPPNDGGPTMSDADMSEDAAGSDTDLGGDAGVDPDDEPTGATDLRARSFGFVTLGKERSGGGATVYDDGFLLGERACTSDGKLCATGGFER